MKLSRRQFFKVGGLTTALLGAGLEAHPAAAAMAPLTKQRLRWTKETPTICPYDASGCGFIVYTDDAGQIINLEGNGDHPINRGGACAKGATMSQIHDNDRRLQKPLYRAPGAAAWEEKSWEWTLDKIARRIKQTRDANWIATDEAGIPVNRTEAIASIGGSALDNEECYLLAKAMRSMGLVFLEHHARL